MSMHLNIKIIIFFLIVLAIYSRIDFIFLCHAQNGISKDRLFSQIRPHVKKYIDELYHYTLLEIKHTTKSEESRIKLILPTKPKPFDAGRYRITFRKNNELKAVICQTESKIGHIRNVVPGKIDIGGQIILLRNPKQNFGKGIILNSDELNYFIQIIYKKFCEPLSKNEANMLNKIKDYALSIMFSGKKGIKEYHENQIKKLQNSCF